MPETVVIGAGPAGLTAAYELAKLGIAATVVEADRHSGGLSRTVSYRGYRFDIGGHRFFSKVAEVNDLWAEILGPEMLWRDRLSRIHYRGEYFDYPLRPVNALLGLGPLEATLIVASYAKAQAFPHQQVDSFERWVTNRFGTRLYETFFKTYTEKVWGIPCSEISADWATQRIKNLSLAEGVRNALFNRSHDREGNVITTLIDRFQYPRLGPGMMWERCRDLAAERGNETLHGHRVERLRHDGERVVALVARTREGEAVEFDVDDVISTMPLRELVESLDPPAPDSVRRAATKLRYRDYLTVVLMLKRDELFPDNWIYVHTPDVKVGRVQNYKNWSPEMVPSSDRTSLGLEYFLWDNDDEWTWSDERLIETGIRECERIGLIDPAEVEDGTVVRMPKAYPVYDRDYAANVATIRAYISRFINLQTIGRNGQHRYNNQDHSMLGGLYAARNLAGERHDVWSINTEQEYLEDGAAERDSGGRAVPTRAPAVDPDRVVGVVLAPLDQFALGVAVGALASLGVFVATTALLLKGGEVVGPNLALLAQYLVGYSVSWGGALVGSLELGVLGFGFGYAAAGLRNRVLGLYASILRRRAQRKEQHDWLDKI